MAGLLDRLTPDQQQLVDLIAQAYHDEGGKWPIFDYLEGTFDADHKDAWEILYGMPRRGQWNYGAVWWVGINAPGKPAATAEIELTILGMHHSATLNDRVPIFLQTLRYMVELRWNVPPRRREPRQLELTAETVQSFLREDSRTPLREESLERLRDLWRREPATWGAGETATAEGIWTYSVPRTVLDYEDVGTIAAYIDRVEALTTIPSRPVAEATPSPLDLVSALDYLDMAWRLAHGRPLFAYPSGERAAKLAFPAGTAEELDSRLTALGEILRTANSTVRDQSTGKLAGQSHEKPLAPLRDFLGRQKTLDQRRVGAAVTTLEAALSIRDAAQHTEAGGRAVIALSQEFNVAHPVVDATAAWTSITTRVVSAITAIREEVVTNPQS